MKTLFDVLGKAFAVLCIVLIAWFTFSWIEVVSRSPGDGKQYNQYNAFVLLEKSKNNMEKFQD